MPNPQTADRQERSEPSVEPACILCGRLEHDTICSIEEMRAHLRFLERFHARRQRQREADTADRTDFTQDYLTAIVSCKTCGLLYRNPRPPAKAVTAAYVDDQYGSEHLESEFALQRTWASAKLDDVAARMTPRSSAAPLVVEVGSFVGGFLAAGRDRGWQMLGIDPGKEVTAFCRQKGLSVHCGTLVEAPIETGSVDTVAIWNTFDQLPNPDTTLAASRRILHEKGLLVIRIPNGRCFANAVAWRERLPRPLRNAVALSLAWNNLLGFPYVYGYTLRTLDELLSRHGFTRQDVVPDTLIQITNRESTRWAQWEEFFVKRFNRWISKMECLSNGTGGETAAWLDVYYRVASTVPDTTITVSTPRSP